MVQALAKIADLLFVYVLDLIETKSIGTFIVY